MSSILIGNVRIKKIAALAPMAGITNSTFRLICKKFGASLVVSEMISAKAICYNDEKTKKMLKFSEVERPIAIQIFGYAPNDMSEAAKRIIEYVNPDIIDINMGCPVAKVVGNFSGSYLMKDPILAGKIIEAVSKTVKIPVTVKIRKGWNEKLINAVEIAKIAEESGAAAVAVHGRTKEEMFLNKSDLDIVRKVKSELKIPVIGNGDITCYKEAKEMYEKTKCDLVMIGRGALGRTWLFSQVKSGLINGKCKSEPNLEEILKLMLEHGRMLCDEFGEKNGIKQIRKHIMWYTKNFYNGTKIRKKACIIETFGEFEELIEEALNYDNDH